ncbi:GTP cyclohydrolase II [Kocuria marina]|uniref:GTP cyclohydrolase II n=1 Tax=Kocuria marina TaxID=223184 RepID=UPI002989FA92|nr:GTP cyclohydrolase II [Kocuria marina]MCT1722483.1 GTP cyclohydrolase II [Kocuria marina]MCT1734688.1 GTP cyclohydrolase II [Kocuria marina]
MSVFDHGEIPEHASPADNHAAPGAEPLHHSDPVTVPSEYGTFSVTGWRVPEPSGIPAAEHVSLTAPPPADEAALPPLLRLHSECLTGDVFGSWRCDCGPQLHLALERISRHGGTVLYLRNHEGRGIGLINKLRAYKLQDGGADTVDANTMLGLPAEARDYTAAARILAAMGLTTVRLLTNNPDKVAKLEALGITVANVIPHEVHARTENLNYLRTKRDRMHHHLTHLNPGETS